MKISIDIFAQRGENSLLSPVLGQVGGGRKYKKGEIQKIISAFRCSKFSESLMLAQHSELQPCKARF